MFEYAWACGERFQIIDEKLNSLYPGFRRLDNTRWSKYWFYPLAATIAPFRFLTAVLVFLPVAFLVGVLTRGQDLEKEPLTGLRRWLVYTILDLGICWEMFVMALRPSIRHVSFDYTEYLGT